ncbi:MAG: hypothetical protein ABJF01_26530 [bacterium]
MMRSMTFSVRRTLTLILMSASAAAGSVASVASIVYDSHRMRAEMRAISHRSPTWRAPTASRP